MDDVKAMATALKMKFEQNDELAKKLCQSRGILAEASVNDLFWGVGLAQYDKRVYNRKNWRGQNKLGEMIMMVCRQLQENV